MLRGCFAAAEKVPRAFAPLLAADPAGDEPAPPPMDPHLTRMRTPRCRAGHCRGAAAAEAPCAARRRRLAASSTTRRCPMPFHAKIAHFCDFADFTMLVSNVR